MAAGTQQEDVAGDPPRDYSGIGGGPAVSPKAEPRAEPPVTDDPGNEREQEWYEDEDDEWFTPHQDLTDRRSSRRRRANANQGSHSSSFAKDDLIVKALKSIVNRQDLPSKPPMGKMPTFADSYRTFPRFRKDVEAFLGDFYARASERTRVAEMLYRANAQESREL